MRISDWSSDVCSSDLRTLHREHFEWQRRAAEFHLMLRRLSLAYAAGLAAALVASIALWAFGHFGVLAKLHVAIAPVLVLYWLYPRLIVGGLWGLPLVLPIGGSVFLRGIVLRLAPTLVTMIGLFPFTRSHARRVGQDVVGMCICRG